MRQIKFRAWDEGNKRMSYELPFEGRGRMLLNEFLQCYEYLMQFTGLTDKNGKQIYEGDIVTEGYHNKYGTYEIKWNKTGFNFGSDDGREYTVLGNIWENPELLKNL